MTLHELITQAPKSDIHVHLDGSLRLETLIDLARERGVALPSQSAAGLREQVFKPVYRDLTEYLQGFQYTCAVLRDGEALERVAGELAQDAIAEGVRYMEVRLAPQLLVTRGQELGGVLRSVAAGLARAARDFRASAAVVSGADMPFVSGIICCAMRNFQRGMSGYYDALLDAFPSMPHKQIVALASQEMARAAVASRDRDGLPVVGFDLAGEEAGYRAGHHAAAYQEAHSRFLRKTVHAGEAYGPESIYEALTLCHAERIGHGTWLFAPDRIASAAITDREGYVNALVEYIATRRITIEVCPTSNLQTMPELGGDLANHPVRRMIERQLPVAVATDNRLVSHTTVTAELCRVADCCQLDAAGVKRLVLAGFKGAFFPGSYAEKRAFVAQAAARIERLAQRSGHGNK
jgi:adenosine deaminase